MNPSTSHKPGAVEPKPTKTGASADQSPRRTLLVVDDDESPRQAIGMIFGDDYELLLAENGQQALDLARTHLIDTAIVDIRMPGMSGIEVLAGLKQIDPAIEVVIVTAYQTLETARQALRLGARDYLMKPFGVPEIRQVVTAAMEHRNATGRLIENARLLSELQEELETQRQQVDSSHIKGELYAGIIHDLNSPLTVVSGMAELLGERLSGVTFVSGEQLSHMRQEVSQLSKHVERCLEISRRYLELFRKRAQSEPETRIALAMRNLQELLLIHPAARANQLIFESQVGEALAQMNSLDLEQVLANLILNALTCTSQSHTVWVTARLRSEPLSVQELEAGPKAVVINESRFQNKPPFVELVVRDDGKGIPEAVMQRMFQPYFSAREAGQGTGLGLSVVRHLVSETTGLLRVESEYGHGAKFTLMLPAITSPKH